MSWARVDDQMAFNSKVVDAGNAAVGAWIRMIAWSCAQGTDGRIPRTTALLIAKTPRVLAEAIRARLLHDREEYIEIHDFLEWNMSASEVADRRSKRAASGSAGGKQRASNTQANAKQVLGPCLNSGEANSNPLPLPLPLPLPIETTAAAIADLPELRPTVDPEHATDADKSLAELERVAALKARPETERSARRLATMADAQTNGKRPIAPYVADAVDRISNNAEAAGWPSSKLLNWIETTAKGRWLERKLVVDEGAA